MDAIEIRFIVIISSIMDWCFGRLLEIAAWWRWLSKQTKEWIIYFWFMCLSAELSTGSRIHSFIHPCVHWFIGPFSCWLISVILQTSGHPAVFCGIPQADGHLLWAGGRVSRPGPDACTSATTPARGPGSGFWKHIETTNFHFLKKLVG